MILRRSSVLLYVLQTGRIALEGPSRDVLANPEVRAAYLGL